MKLPEGGFRYEWFDPAKGAAGESGEINSNGGAVSFRPPFAGEAVLYLKR